MDTHASGNQLETSVIICVMLQNVDEMPPYPRQLLQVFLQGAMNSPELNQTKKTVIENLCQQIVKTWISKDLI